MDVPKTAGTPNFGLPVTPVSQAPLDERIAKYLAARDLSQLVVDIQSEYKRQETICLDIASGKVPYSLCVSLYNQLTIPKIKAEARDAIVYFLLWNKDQSNLQRFVITLPAEERDGVLFEAANDLIEEARDTTIQLHKTARNDCIGNYFENYHKYNYALKGAIHKSLLAYQSISSPALRYCLINALFASAIYFPSITVNDFIYSWFKLSSEQNNLLNAHKISYQAYLEQHIKKYAAGQGFERLHSFHEYLGTLAQDPANPACHAAASTLVFFDYFTKSRKEHQTHTEKLASDINKFIESEKNRIKNTILDSIITIHIEQKNLESLIFIFERLFDPDIRAVAYLRVGEKLLSANELSLFQGFMPEILKLKNFFKVADQPKVDLMIVRGAALAFRLNSLAFAESLTSLIPGRREEILLLSRKQSPIN